MATLTEILGGYFPISSFDAFAPYRDPNAPIAQDRQTNTDVVPMFKRPQRFYPLPAPFGSFNPLPGNNPNGNTPVVGQQIVPQNSKRTGLMITNAGFGCAYISTFENVSRQDYPIQPLESIFITPSTPVNIVPTNAIYAIGETGSDIRVLEIILNPVGSEFVA